MKHNSKREQSRKKAQSVTAGERIAKIIWGTWLRRIISLFLAVCIFLTGTAYGISQWYSQKHAKEPLQIGVTFIPGYARYFGLDPKETLEAIIDELGVKRVRLVSYWNIGEPENNTYNFDEFDWQFKMAEEKGVKVSLAIGLRQPRWPECHMPEWAASMPIIQWSTELKEYMKVVIDRYKTSPALESYQLENEFFMDVFGICPDHSRTRLIDEFDFVKRQDPTHPVIISRSNNWIGIPIGDPQPDQFGISVYKRVWDKTITKRYFEYPLPPWFYGFLAGAGEIVTGKDMIIHELQAEAWLPEGYMINNPDDIAEMEKSMNPERLRHRIQYAKDTGIKTIDLWGVEWWYWQKEKLNDPGLWNAAKESINN